MAVKNPNRDIKFGSSKFHNSTECINGLHDKCSGTTECTMEEHSCGIVSCLCDCHVVEEETEEA